MSGQPADKYFGKYNSLEEAETGFQNTVSEMVKMKQIAADAQAELQASRAQNEQLATIAEQLIQRGSQSASQPTPQLVDDEGNLDVTGLLGQIDNQLAQQRTTISQEVQAAVTQALAPIVNLQKAKASFNPDNLDARWSDAEFQRTLASNPTYSTVFNKLVSDPDTSGAAYSTVYDLWRANNPPVNAPNTARQEAKRQAGAPEPMGGQPADVPIAGQLTLQELGERAKIAQDIMNPDAQVAFAKEFIKGGKLERIVNVDPDWVD